jgi:site-specific recombinase XerD
VLDAETSLNCASLSGKHVTPHALRHTLAMDLLDHGVDRSSDRALLGPESVETTSMYLRADMQLEEAALARTRPPMFSQAVTDPI